MFAFLVLSLESRWPVLYIKQISFFLRRVAAGERLWLFGQPSRLVFVSRTKSNNLMLVRFGLPNVREMRES